MNLVLDAGGLIGIDRDDRRTAGLIELGRRSAARLVTTTPVVGQAWRDGALQARLARTLPMIDVQPVEVDDAREAGELLGRARRSDVVDALLVALAVPGDQVLTSDRSRGHHHAGRRGTARRPRRGSVTQARRRGRSRR